MFQVLLFSVALAALAVWAGRRALPRLKLQDWRIASGGLAALLFLGGLAASMKGNYLIGGALMAAGLGLAFSARFRPRPKSRPLPQASDSEARAALQGRGVRPSLNRAPVCTISDGHTLCRGQRTFWRVLYGEACSRSVASP
jgi:hypothetical protein